MNAKLTISSEKQKRLEKALRENLRKRKSQQREREDKEKAVILDDQVVLPRSPRDDG
jgi:hypothetical protein